MLIRQIPILCALAVAVTANLLVPARANAEALDIYLVYSADVRGQKTDLKKTLSEEYNVKSYNIAMLSVADYSGRQKIMTKLTSARVIVLLGSRSIDILGNRNHDSTLAIDAKSEDPVTTIKTWFEARVTDNP